MNTISPENFMDNYLASWTTKDASARKEIIEAIWSPSGELSVSSAGETFHGINAITEHINAVHDDMITEKGLSFSYDQQLESGQTLLVRWSVTAPSGDIAGRGVDTITFNESGQIAAAQMFMGIN